MILQTSQQATGALRKVKPPIILDDMLAHGAAVVGSAVFHNSLAHQVRTRVAQGVEPLEVITRRC